VCAPAAWVLRGTYKVGVGGLLELLLGAVADVRIWDRQSGRHERRRRGRDSIPGEKVPSNTWLISMIAGGCGEGQRGVSVSSGRRGKGAGRASRVQRAAARKERLRSCGGRGVGRELEAK
jgi:hypothetical protein